MKSPVPRVAAAVLCAVSAFLTICYVSTSVTAAEVPPVDQLPADCRAAKAEFHPLTAADLLEVKVELADAVARLERRLRAAGENGANWRKYLQVDRLRAQLEKGKTPDLAVLDAVYKRYTAGHEGLELVWFVDVGEALRRYRETARNVGDPELRSRYEQLLDFLAPYLETYVADPTAEKAAVIGQAVIRLEEARQAPGLVEAIRHHFLRPNLLLRVSADMVVAGVASPVDETGPVHEVILGTDVYGTGRTTGRLGAELSPEQSRGVIDAVFRGAVATRNIGYHGPVRIYSNGSTRISARKRFWIDATGLRSLPAASSAATRTEITDIRSRRGNCCIERIAWRRTCKQKGQAECIASRRAEMRLNERMDQQALEKIGQANRAFLEKFRRPLMERKLFPRQLDFATTREALYVTSLQADQSQLAAPTVPPGLPEDVDLVLSLHESMINNLAASALAGMTLRAETFNATIVSLLGELPEQLQADEDQGDWAISFSRGGQPISVVFAEDGFRVSVRGRTFYKEGEPYPGMDVTVDYKIAKTEHGFNAVRQGDLRILPPGFVAGRGKKLTPRQVVIRTLLERRFEKIFKPEMMGEGFVPPGEWGKLGKMMPVHLACKDGWLTVGWKRAPAGQTVAQSLATTGSSR
jgi:hypothetical protein